MAVKQLKKTGGDVDTRGAVVLADDGSAFYHLLADDRTRGALPEATVESEWEDVGALGGGGGSAFAHLTEDTDSSQIKSDWTVVIGVVGAAADLELYADGSWASYIADDDPETGWAYLLSKWSAGAPHFGIKRDGSLNWSDQKLFRNGNFQLAVADPNDWGTVFSADGVADGAAGFVQIYGPDGSAVFNGGNPSLTLVGIGVNSGTWTVDADGFHSDSTISFNGWLQGSEIADPAAPAANTGTLYFKDVGGKTALVARFPTGAVQQIAIEP